MAREDTWCCAVQEGSVSTWEGRGVCYCPLRTDPAIQCVPSLSHAPHISGALLFIPAACTMQFMWFPASLYVLTFGLAFLETTANPYILSMGDEQTATQRLNLAQAFNPVGSLLGMCVASQLVLADLWPTRFTKAATIPCPEDCTLEPFKRAGRLEGLGSQVA